jgi:hypothetical protein
MPISTIDQKGLTNPLTSVAANTVTSAAATALTLQSAGTTAVTIDTSQNVGIGTSNPAGKRLYVLGGGAVIDQGSVSGATLILNRTSNPGSVAFHYAGTETGQIQAISGGGLNFYIGSTPTERMRIDSTGMVNVGTGGNGEIYVGRNTTIANAKLEVTGSGNMLVTNNTDTGVGAINVLYIIRNSNNVGTIQCTNIATSFNTSSDYRLKENIAPMTGALATVAQLKPVTYKWKIDGSDGQGFIAHELAEIVPDCVSGEKDAVDANGKPIYQGVDTSFLVATLTAAIQELKAEFDAYKASHP